MRGTCVVVGMVLLLVLTAHLQREGERRDDESAMTPRTAGGCAASTADLEAELADATAEPATER